MHFVFLAAAGFIAGAMNALAGGGSFVSMPALIAFPLPATIANASSTVALVPGAMTSAWPYRREIRRIGPFSLTTLFAIAMIGGIVGAVLLLITPTTMFDKIIPWLLLVATIFLWFGQDIRAALAARGVHVGKGAAFVLQGLLAVYGGYFGGGLGLMTMALWTMLSDLDIKAMQGTRIVMVGLCNIAAVVCFVVAGAVAWAPTLALLAGALVGGYAGAHLGRRLPVKAVRIVIMGVSLVTTIAFFMRAYA
jgi:uncharacterized membrane protein YfcA